jgi:hypothetical protein
MSCWERSVLLLEQVEGVLEPVSISESTMLGHKSTRFALTLPRLARELARSPCHGASALLRPPSN